MDYFFVLLFGIPIFVSVLLTLPFIFLFPWMQGVFTNHYLLASIVIGVLHSLFVFCLIALVLITKGLPADERAGEVVAIYLLIALLCLLTSQIAYWSIRHIRT